MLLNDENMSGWIDDLLNQEEIDLGNHIRYTPRAGSFHSREKINYLQMENNLRMIYGDEETCEIYITLFDKMRTFVADVLQVPGLGRLDRKSVV